MRGALFVGTVFAAMALAGCLQDSTTQATSANPLGLPYERADCMGKGKLHEYDMYIAENSKWTAHDDNEVGFFQFGLSPDGPFTTPGPEFRIKQCDTLRVLLHDPAGFHTIHWHGQSVPWRSDGVPFMTQDVTPGVYRYEFQAFEAGTYWYHCHVEAPSHIDAGLFGALIVEPLEPEIPYDRDPVLILSAIDAKQDELFSVVTGRTPSTRGAGEHPMDAVDGAERGLYFAVGLLATPEAPREYYPQESIRYRPQYDTFMINGKSFPDTEPVFIKEGEVVRMRVINASPLVHHLHIHGHHALVTHKDGFPLPAPYWGDSFAMASGERLDLYIYGDNPGIWDLHDHGGGWGYGGHAANDYAFPGGMSTMIVYEDFEYAKLPGPEATAGDFMVFAPSYG